MVLSEEIKNSLEESVLCWLATADSSGLPSVSPKEVFCSLNDLILIANIASPGSERNLKQNPKACISFIHILKQKGFQLKGSCSIIHPTDGLWDTYFKPLDQLTARQYPIKNIFLFKTESVKPIIAPSYFVFPEQSVEDKINSAKRSYHMK